MEYLLKASAISAIFFICYKLFLQRETFFNQNRWFLAGGLLGSFLIPLVIIPIYIEYTPVAIPNYNFGEVVVENTEKPFDILKYLPMVYLLGAAFFSIRFLVQLASLSMVIFKTKKEKKGRYTYLETNTDISPFSFFNWIVYNPDQFNKTELDQIIAHEKIHAKQCHSVDMLLSQLACVVFWFNPFIWFYNKMIKQNLEFIADQITQNKFDTKSYQTTLLKTSMPSHQMALSNNFYNSLIKKRIVMLHKSKSKKINLIKYAIVIPLLALFLMSFNTEEILVPNKSLEELATQAIDPLYILDGKEISKEKYNALDSENILSISVLKGEKAIEKYGEKGKYGVIEITTKKQIPIKSGEHLSDIKIIGYDKAPDSIIKIKVGPQTEINMDTHPLIIVDGKEITNKALSNLDKNSFESIDILKDEKAIDKYGDKGKNGVVEIISKNQKSIKVGNTLSDVKVIGYGENMDSTKVGTKVNQWSTTAGQNNLSDSIYFDKTRVIGYGDSLSHNKTGDKISPWKVSVGINKDRIATYKQGSNDPMILLNGKEVSDDEVRKVNPDDIESVDVIKIEQKIKKYGDRGKNGVVSITTKNNNDLVMTGKSDAGVVIQTSKDKISPIYILKGKEITEEQMKAIAPKDISEISVLKGEKAIEKYGEKGKNGVIEITTKK